MPRRWTAADDRAAAEARDAGGTYAAAGRLIGRSAAAVRRRMRILRPGAGGAGPARTPAAGPPAAGPPAEAAAAAESIRGCPVCGGYVGDPRRRYCRLCPAEARARWRRAGRPAAPPNPGALAASWARSRLVVPPGHPLAGRPMPMPGYLAAFAAAALSPGVAEAALVIARKNGKSACVAMLLLAHLVGPLRRPGWRAAVVSVDRGKAGELTAQMESIARASGIGVVEAQVRRGVSRTAPLGPSSVIVRRSPAPGTIETLAGRVEVLSADRTAGHASGYDLVIVDETGLMRERDRALLEGLETSVSARGGRIVHLSIRGSGPHLPELIERARRRPETVAHVHAGEGGAPLADERNWRRGNPGLEAGIKSMDYMRQAAGRAALTPAAEPAFRGLDLNETIEPAADLLVPLSRWQACERAARPPRLGPCYLGVDLGQTVSFSAAAAYWPSSSRLEYWVGAPAQPPLLQRGEQDGVGGAYELARSRGEIRICGEAATVDNPVFLGHVLADLGGAEIRAAGADRYRRAEVQAALARIGADVDVAWRGAGASARADGSHDVRAFQAAVIEGRLAAPQGGVMPLAALRGAVLRYDGAGNPALDRATTRGRIDLAAAIVIAVGLAAADLDRDGDPGSYVSV